MTFRDEYRRLYDQTDPSPGLVNRTIQAARPVRRTALRRTAALVLCCVLVLSIATSALAATNPEFNQWLYRYAPATAMLFRPVNSLCRDQGIIMEVQAIHIDGNTAEIYVTVTDTLGTRLDATVDLFDSYAIDTPGDSSASCTLAEWNDAANQATFLIHYTAEKPIRQDKLTFSVGRLLTGKEETILELSCFDPSAVSPVTLTDPGDSLRGWGSFVPMEMDDARALGMMLLDTEGTEILPGVYYLGAGLHGDELRVQMRYDDIGRTDNHGFLWLVTAEGEEISYVNDLSVWADNKRDSIEEYIFSVTPEQLAGVKLMGDFHTCDTLIEGDWSVTFAVTEMAHP